MSQFIRLLGANDKAAALEVACNAFRSGEENERFFRVDPKTFDSIPGKPFAYWITESIQRALQTFPTFERSDYVAEHGVSTKDDFRFLRADWEVIEPSDKWLPFAKGGSYSPFYADLPLRINWQRDAEELEAALLHKYPYLGESANWVLHRECRYGHPGLTWSKRTTSSLSMRVLPKGCVFSDKGSAAFVKDDCPAALLALLGLCSSAAFRTFIQLQLAAGNAGPGGAANSYEVGVIQRTPLPHLDDVSRRRLEGLARRGWFLNRILDTVQETSHAFLLPLSLRSRLGAYEPSAFETELSQIQEEIDRLSFELYRFTDRDRDAAMLQVGRELIDADDEDDDTEDSDTEAPSSDSLLSWAIGVAFGRFDWRLATGERSIPDESDPFDPLPTNSPGMLPMGLAPFHQHSGVLVEDAGHRHDLVRLTEEVLTRVNTMIPDDVRRWVRREFFAFHLHRYSKSRRIAPIYWPLSTASGDYTLWIYYPSLTSQTLYTAINDFVEPKLKQVEGDVSALRNKGGARTRDEEKQFEAVQSFQMELIELRDTLLELAPTFKPKHDDGVQITAAPLWPLFRHKPWQKVLKETWTKLEKGDHDWAHLAMNYWPERVREKCKTDKSLAIAHALEALYVKPEIKPKKQRGKKKPEVEE